MANSNCLEGVECPKCKSDERFKIVAKVLVEVTDNGTQDIGGDYEWDKESYCECCHCGHYGTLRQFCVNKETVAYEFYYDACERANCRPLPYDAWMTADKPDSPKG